MEGQSIHISQPHHLALRPPCSANSGPEEADFQGRYKSEGEGGCRGVGHALPPNGER